MGHRDAVFEARLRHPSRQRRLVRALQGSSNQLASPTEAPQANAGSIHGPASCLLQDRHKHLCHLPHILTAGKTIPKVNQSEGKRLLWGVPGMPLEVTVTVTYRGLGLPKSWSFIRTSWGTAVRNMGHAGGTDN